MRDPVPDLDRQIAEIEASLKLPLPDAARHALEERRTHLLAERAAVQGAVTIGGAAHVAGPVVGVNFGVIQAFFGAQPPDDAKELLDHYLETLVAEYGRVRLGKLLGKEQTGREQLVVPDLSLRAVYTALALTSRVRVADFADQDRKVVLEAIDAGDPARVLPDQVRLALLRAAGQPGAPGPHQDHEPALGGAGLVAQWAAQRRVIATAPDARLSGQWYRPELPLQAVGAHPRLALLGGPGSGKSTVLRYLTIWLAEALLAGRDPAHPLPIPFFCQLGRVAQQLGPDPERDLDTLIDALVAPVVGAAGLRAGLRATIFHAWRRGGALLCLDGLDEVVGTTERGHTPSRRERVAEAIRRLAAQLGRARIVVTCRTKPYEQDAAWQLRDDWTVRALEPFTFGQVRRFIPAWYAQTARSDQPKYTPAEAQARAEGLVAVLERRPALQDLTASPLLLTMLTLLHYNKKQLPDERADVYEELVELLLERWEGVRSADRDRRSESIGERLGLPQLTADGLRPAMHAIAFAAHAQAVDGRGVLAGEVMRRTLDAFFARILHPADPQRADRAVCAAHSDRLIELLREETGLIQEEDDETYVLPHLTFEEYLAACHLAGREDVALAYAQWRAGGDRWREALLLLMGRLRRQEKFALAYAWLELLVAARVGEDAKPAAQRQRDALLAVACYDALGRRAPFAGRPHDLIGFEERLRAALVDLLERPDPALLLPQRLEAGTALGALGDPRYPVTADEWRAELARRNDAFGALAGYWRYVRPGSYRIGGWDKRQKAADIALPGFWIARFPITVAQYAPFVDAGYGLEAERWWTTNGWRWKGNRTQPAGWNEPSYSGANQPVIGITWYEATAFCAWLSAQVADALPKGYVVRLPTEAEWEAAAAYDADMQRRSYPWGEEDPTPERAIYDASGLGAPGPVGCCPAGAAACGALDLAGNVWEWTASSFNRYPEYSGQPEKDFTQNQEIVPLRGGAHYSNSTFVRCGARLRILPVYWVLDLGFRVLAAPRLAR